MSRSASSGSIAWWLYKQPQLPSEIERLREIRPSQEEGAVRAHERSSEASLRQRLQTLLAENQRLRAENTKLTEELALAYGRQRELSLLPATPAAGDRPPPKEPR